MSARSSGVRGRRMSGDQPAGPPSSQMMIHSEVGPVKPSSPLGPSIIEIQDKVLARQRKPSKGAMDLMNRLYDSSNNSQAIAAVHQREKLLKRRASQSGDDILAPSKPTTMKKPPPEVFKTMLYQGDYKRKKAHDPYEEIMKQFPNRLLHKVPPRAAKELLEPILTIPLRATSPDRESMKSFRSEGGKSPLAEIAASQEKKTVTFRGINRTPEPRSSARMTSARKASPVELPTPVQSVQDPEGMEVTESQVSPRLTTNGRPTSSRSSSSSPRPSSRTASRHKDLSVVLNYKKKNVYDDTIPENDNFVEVVMEMREKLGWKTELPRHGTGCKEKMGLMEEKIEDDDKEDQEESLSTPEDDGAFVYAVERNRDDPKGKYNPYDLEVVSAHVAHSQSVHYMGTASSVVRISVIGDKEEAVRQPVLWWLWERRLFNQVHNIQVFVQFRLWKSFRTWRDNVRHQQTVSCNTVLSKTLFTANEILQGCLLHVRSLCEAASGSLNGIGEGESAISLVRFDKTVTMTLDDFLTIQSAQHEHALTQINALRDRVVELVWESCATVAEMEGVTHGIRDSERKVTIVDGKVQETGGEEEDPKKLKHKNKSQKSPIPGQEKKPRSGKKGRPTYAQIAEWRKILARLSYFLRSVDYLLLELLRRLVIAGTRQMLTFTQASTQAASLEQELEEQKLQMRSQMEREDTDADTLKSPSKSTLTSEPTGTGKQKSFKSFKSTITNDSTEPYSPPKFDFNATEVIGKPPGVDEVLAQINKQNEVIEIPKPILSIQLVLNVPQPQPKPARKLTLGSQNLSPDPNKKGQHVNFVEGVEAEEKDNEEDEEFESEFEESDGEYHSDDEESAMSPPSSKGKQPLPKFAFENIDERKATEEAMQKQNKVYVSLNPSNARVKASFRGIVTGFENTIAQVVSMLKEPRLSVFYSPPKHDLKLNYDVEMAAQKAEEEDEEVVWPDTRQLLGGDPDYQKIISSIMEIIDEVMDEVSDFSRDYDDYCDMVNSARKMDVEKSMAKQPWSTDEFLHVLRVHTDQESQMEAMQRVKRLGAMRVEVENFCQSALPYPRTVLKGVRSKLPVIAYQRNEDLLSIIKGACRKLDHYPESVEEFVDHLSFLGKMAQEMPALEKEYKIVTKLYTIARDFDISIEPEELALYQTLSPSFQHLKTIILYAEAKKDDNIRKFSADLNQLIDRIRSRIIEIKTRVGDPVLLNGDTMASTALERISILTEDVTEMTSKTRNYGNYQERFGSSISKTKKPYGEEFVSDKKDDSAQDLQAELGEIERDITLRRLLWESAEEWDRLETEWTASSFDQLNVESLQKNVNRFTQTVYMLEKGLPHNEVVPRLKEKVMNFKLIMPCITSLRNPSLKARHWESIARIIGKAIEHDTMFTLGNLIEMNIIKYKDAVQDISTTASNEATLERMLEKVVALWQSTDFRLVPHASGQVSIISGADDILAMLEESQVTVGTIRGSRYVTPIKAQVEDWERRLALFARTLDEWMTCQRNWLYLEQIFTTPDIQRQLPNEFKLFSAVDKTWHDTMRRTEDRPNALRSATTPGVLEALQSANISLEKIQKCLEDYLETKRLVFPRFYFLSNDELLDILAQSKNPDAVQPHLTKCFGNVQALDIRNIPRQPPTVKTITSAEGEILEMPKNVRARGPVEQWLGSVEQGMFEAVKRHLKMGLQDWLTIVHHEWVQKHPGQVVLTVAQIMFNKTVLGCFTKKDPRQELRDFLARMVAVLNDLAGLVSTNLSPHRRLSINALLTINVHNRDILTSMIENKITRKDDFEWTRQLRYEWDEQTNNCNVLQSAATFVYGYEYLGCSPRLVITPLTDRCNLTLTGALNLNLGGSPAGPAGTGKTETVKDLAKALGKQCVVFNCSEGLDYRMLGKMFSGLSQSGSWCCFDEFNRIDIEVLSVVAQQIHTIKAAKDQCAPRFLFEGRDIKLNMQCGFFITMNPSYAGRVELPDNLKSLFRQVAMMVPDYALIAEIMLFSEGFTAAKSLSTKIVNLYQLASKQLSQQDHYDFGMRAIKSVLVMAGQRKRQLMLRDNLQEISQVDEAHLLIHALQDANMPKFIAEDVPLFESIMADLFPGVSLPEQDTGTLEKAISMAVRDQGLQLWPNQMEKVKQLHSQLLVRHGVMLVGPTGGGKTAARNILQRALVLLPAISVADEAANLATNIAARGPQLSPLPDGRNAAPRRPSMFSHHRQRKGQVEVFTVNPKCVKLGELYGATDPHTFEWSDGLIATAARKFARDHQAGAVHRGGDDEGSNRPASSSTITSVAPSDQGDMDMDSVPINWKWVVLDGPVDTIWVENLNTVLDDSKVLCLANGERIGLTPSMRLMFEVDDLSQASPATISRCAMVYMDPVELGWRPFVRTWLNRMPRELGDQGRKHLEALFEHSVDRGLTFLRQHSSHQTVKAPDMAIVMCLCNILAAFFEFMAKNGGFGAPDQSPPPPGSADSSDNSRGPSRVGSRQGKRKSRRLDEQSSATMEAVPESKLTPTTSNDAPPKYYLQRCPHQLVGILGKLFVFAYTWSFGGNFKRQDDMDDGMMIGGRSNADISNSSKPEVVIDIASDFDTCVRELFETEPPLGVRLPSNKSIYSYFLDLDSGNFIAWDSLIPTTTSLIEKGAVITIGDSPMGGAGGPSKQGGDGEIVPTVDTVRYSFLAALLLLNKNPVLITGESGVGKSAIMKHMLKELEKEGGTTYKSGTLLGNVLNFTDKNQMLLDNISSLTRFADHSDSLTMDLTMGGAPKQRPPPGLLSSVVQFSAQTSAARTQLALTHRLIKKGRDTLGAPKGKRCVVFVDDLNLPAPEEYGAQPPLELLRQFLDMGGFYDTHKLQWKDILDVTLMAACGPPGGGRNPVSPRLLKHFCMFALPQPSTRSLQHIYQVQLGRFFQENEFMPEVRECLFPLVSAAIAIYYRMCGAMRPTPAKIHYTFNIRDLSQVITGLLRADESTIVNSDNCAQLFAHEATRVFHDRLVNSSDAARFYDMLSDILHDYFKVKWSGPELMNKPILFGDFLEINEATSSSRRIYKPIPDRNRLNQVLEEAYMQHNMGNPQAPQIVFFKEAVEHIVRAARVFRQPGGHMLMVGMDGTGKTTTVNLACYIAECDLFKLTLTRGYSIIDFREDLKKVCIMAGVRGSSTVFLLSDGDIVKETFLEDVNCILNSGEVPDLFDNEEMDGIAMDLKAAAAESSVPDTRVAVYQFFIQRVKRNLHIVLAMSPAGSRFRQRCRMNPSLINCCTIDWYQDWEPPAMLSVAQVYFQSIDFGMRTNVGASITTTDEEMPATDSLKALKVLKDSVAEMCVKIHGSIEVASQQYWEEMRRRYYITPSSYMELIRLYSNMLTKYRSGILVGRQRLGVGLSRLSEAESLVGTMKVELVTLGPRIEEKAKDTEVLLVQLDEDKVAVDEIREIVEAEEIVMKKETQVVQNYADECQRDLASVVPALQMAIESLNTLDKSDISEVKVYARPPELVTMVMAAVCTLLSQKPDWQTAKLVLGDPQFLKRLVNYDKNTTPEKIYHKLKKYSKHPDFKPEIVGRVSLACKSMCQWVLALEHYHEVYKMAKPKQKRVNEAKAALQLAQEKLAKKQASLAQIEEHLASLQQQYTDSMNQRESLKEKKRLTGIRLERAAVLIAALSNEKVRWRDGVQDLDVRLEGVIGDSLVSAGAVAYLGAFNTKYRQQLLDKWAAQVREAGIPMAKDYQFVSSCVDANQILRWHNEGLPHDNHSTQNGVIVNNAQKWPLLIDPQGQAANWIKKMEGHKLKVVEASDPNFMRGMERAIRVGEPVLLQDVTNNLDPSLKPILLQETFVRGGHTLIRLGDTDIEYNNNFRLYMTTSVGNPDYLPAVCIQVTLINSIVMFDGLQEQLLSAVVRQEKPKLELARSELLANIAKDREVLRAMEDKSLSLLQKTEGHILDDQVLVSTLQNSKIMSEEIKVRIAESELTEKQLSQARKKYLPVATRGAVLYFVLADLAGIDVMYQFSLNWFRGMFTNQINAVGGGEEKNPLSSQVSTQSNTTQDGLSHSDSMTEVELNQHMQLMIDRLTSAIYRVVSVALFAHHQLMFSFMVNSSIGRKDGSIPQHEWTVFLQGNVMASMMDEATLEAHDGLTALQRKNGGESVPSRSKHVMDTHWMHCQHLEATFPDTFSVQHLCRSIRTCHEQWIAFAESEQPYHLMAKEYKPEVETYDPEEMVVFCWEKLTPFQRLLLVKAIRPSALVEAIRCFVEEQMGEEFVTSGTPNLEEMFHKADAKTPLIFILSPGSDPGPALLRFAKELRGSVLHVDMISLGRGQGPKAEELISKAQILKGRWIFLQNCHLAASWMPRLQTIVENFNKPGSDHDPQFRLWLSSKPDPCFPISILQSGLKMTVEPPIGVRNNLQRTFGAAAGMTVTERVYEETVQSHRADAWKNLLLGLCFFNAVIHERKKFRRLGWNIPYEFNDSDLEVSMLELKMLLHDESDSSDNSSIPWAALCYLTGEVTFGGRVTDDWDRRCLHSLLQKFYTPNALQPNYYYSEDKVYHPLPPGTSLEGVREYLDSLPAADTPELFGMDENADTAFLEAQAEELVAGVLSVQPRLLLTTELLAEGKTSDQIVLQLGASMMESIPHSMDEAIEREMGPTGPTSVSQVSLKLADIVKIGSGDYSTLKKRPKDPTNKKDKTLEVDKTGVTALQKICQSALFTVLRQELDRFSSLLKVIHNSLASLQLAVNGEVVMSQPLEEAYSALLSQRVPAQWKACSWESVKPLGAWTRNLVLRVEFFAQWAVQVIRCAERALRPPILTTQQQQQSQQSNLQQQAEAVAAHEAEILATILTAINPRSFWLSAFFFPQGFLTAVLQNHARKKAMSVDSLVFDFAVQDHRLRDTENSLSDLKSGTHIKTEASQGAAPPDDGVLVFGLFIDGARWDPQYKVLSDSLPGQRMGRLPEIHFIPKVQELTVSPTPNLESPLALIQTTESQTELAAAAAATASEEDLIRARGPSGVYEAPLYRTSTRAGTLSSTGHSTNFVTAVLLPTYRPQQVWVMRGVALLCQKDD